MTDSSIIEKIINTLTTNRQIITECFQTDTLFEMQLQLSFQDFLNHDVGKYNMSELLANYADKILRKGGVKGEKKVLEEQLENLAQIFTYLYDKDLFLVVYRTQLARRLLQEMYEDFELEKQLITRLKVTCGMQ